MSLDESGQAKIAEIAPLADCFPGVVIIHNTRTRCVEYMSPRGLQLLCTTPEELHLLGAEYHNRFFNAEESAEYVPKVWELLSGNDLDQIISFFQQVRTTESADWSLYMTTMKLLLRGSDGLPLLLICFACPVDPASHVTLKVQRLLDENNFLRRHQQQFVQLTAREREVLRLIAMGYSAPEVAAELHIAPHTAETHRRNLRRKLQADSVFALGQYARAFDLI